MVLTDVDSGTAALLLLLAPSADAALVLGLALVLAWVLDASFGELPNALHPVAWLGRLLHLLGRTLRRLPPCAAFCAGALAWSALGLGLAAAALEIQRYLLGTARAWSVLLLAVVLKPCFAWRMLRDEVAAVEAATRRDVAAGRERLARLVSRDVRQLDVAGVRESAIETLAENLNDSVVAPLFWYALFGLPGAVVYRFANTADAVWGYRGEWEWAGKWAARADDALSWLPARVSALLLWPTLRLKAWRCLRAQALLTPSPNGGWPMGAMALRLGVRLAKPGVYVLNEQAASPRTEHAVQALRLAGGAAWTAAGLASLSWWSRAL